VCGCTKTTCSAENKNCGSISDGCGGSLDCGSCSGLNTCGGGGTPGVCGSPCGEASCVAPDGQYISHFTGLGCTGTESYYTPYNGYAFKCNPWNSIGAVCGTQLRTETNRSYKDTTGNCNDAWPSGNPLGEFVRVYR
jgi:hypothetical protein